MASDTSSFVTTIPLRTTPRDVSILRKRFGAARSVYNALLGECIRRRDLMRQSRDWRKARNMPKGAERTKAFRTLAERFKFREYDLYPFIQEQRRFPGIGDHLDAHTCQALAARAFAAVERSVFKGGRVRFRRAGEFRSVEGTGMKSPLHWDGNAVAWNGLRLVAAVDPDDEVITHGLKHRVRYCRLVRMTIRGRERYFAQLVQEGEAFKKPEHRPGSGAVGLDLGPSTIAFVTDKAAGVERFCDELDERHGEIAGLQRQADRQTRANNQECFDDRGRWIKGRRMKVRSKGMRRTWRKRAELQRREQAHRKNLHGRLVNRVLSMGDDVRLEKLSYFGFQRAFGRSVRVRAPGMFVARLKVSAAKWGAVVTEFNPGKAMCSQVCLCGTLRKKKLSERTHECDCGVKSPRDVLSAHLARFVGPDGRVDVPRAAVAWARLCNASGAASIGTNVTTGGVPTLAHGGPSRRRSASRQDSRRNLVSAADAVAGPKGTQARAAEKLGDGGTPAPADFTTDANGKRPAAYARDARGIAPGRPAGSRGRPVPPGPQLDLWPGG